MSYFEKKRHNPIELIKRFWPDASIDHITYDPDMRKGEYDIIRQSGGDGTLLFVRQLLQEGVVTIVNMATSFKPTAPKDMSKVKAIKYIVGPMRHVTVFGMIFLRCSKEHKYPGQRDRVRMPVRCQYVLF